MAWPLRLLAVGSRSPCHWGLASGLAVRVASSINLKPADAGCLTIVGESYMIGESA